MTETTDIKALRDAAALIAHGYKQRWGCETNEDTGFVGIGTFDHDGDLCPFIEVSVSNWSDEDGDDERLAEFLTLANPVAILALLDQLEAERQQREAAEKERDRLLNQEFQQRLANAEHQLEMKDLAIRNVKASRMAQFRKRKVAEAELAELRGTQEPDHYRYSCGSCGYETLAYTAKCPTCNYHKIEEEPLFTRQPKPVVNLNHIGRITAQISGQRYTYFSAEDIRHYFEEMKCEIIERKSPISDTVYEPQRANPKPVVVLPDINANKYLTYAFGASVFDKSRFIKDCIEVLSSSGIVVKDGE